MKIIKEKEVEVGSRKRYLDNNRKKDRSSSNRRWRSGSRASTNRDRIRCYKGREYDHFPKDCPTTKEGRDRANSANV